MNFLLKITILFNHWLANAAVERVGMNNDIKFLFSTNMSHMTISSITIIIFSHSAILSAIKPIIPKAIYVAPESCQNYGS